MRRGPAAAPRRRPRTSPPVPASRGASIAFGCSPRQGSVRSVSHAPARSLLLHLSPLMRALVIGASGQVGAALLHALRSRGHEARGTHAQNAGPALDQRDLTDHAAVARAVAQARADWIFCPAGLSYVDYCEEHPDEAMASNRDGPAAAARAAEAARRGFVYSATDYVFDGKTGPLGENDSPRPLCLYGRSKH